MRQKRLALTNTPAYCSYALKLIIVQTGKTSFLVELYSLLLVNKIPRLTLRNTLQLGIKTYFSTGRGDFFSCKTQPSFACKIRWKRLALTNTLAYCS
jgi:hypothetical protein